MNPAFTADEYERLELALKIRETEEKLLHLFQSGEIHGTVHTCVGQEFTGVSVCTQLKANDFVFSNHRGHGHFIAFTGNVRGLLAELLGRTDGVCGGLGGSQHLCDKNFFSNGIQGGIVSVSLGLALAKKIKNQKSIGAVFIGDGTLGEGNVYEAFNIASLWALPLLFVLEDNGMAQSTPTRETTAGSILGRPEAFGIRTFQGSTEHWQKLHQTAAEAISFVRENQKPAFLWVKTQRLRAHSKGDDTRGEREIEVAKKQDFLTAFSATPEGLNILKKVRADLEAELALAFASPLAKMPVTKSAPMPNGEWQKVSLDKSAYVGKSIQRSFQNLMAQDERIIFLGEDVLSPYGGAFKISQKLSELYPQRVLGTPISEASIIGLATGLSMDGFKPFAEIMFGDFLTLAFDQIANHAAKFPFMYNQKVSVDMVVRTPVGGRRGYGPTHSQSLEKHFLGIPGLRVLALHNLLEPEKVYGRLARGGMGPTLLIENKVGYTQSLGFSVPEGFEVLASDQEFPALVVRPSAGEIRFTLFCYGAMTEEVLQAAEELFRAHDIICQILIPTQIYPFNIESFRQYINKAPVFLCVEESNEFASLSAEVIAQLACSPQPPRCFRLSAPDMPIPGAAHLEKEMLPDALQIINFVRQLNV